ncbi:MAG: AsmA family protein [Xanthomonadales bacterium]|nr:AsmA family protein [Xanthomonadales bacterium]
MKKIFKWLLVLIVALAVGLTILLYNPHMIKGPVERYLSDFAGYSITLDGELEINTGKLIQIGANDISVSAPEWARHDKVVVIGRMNLVLNTASLFKDIILVETLEVDDLQINLETDDKGKGNWITANRPSSPPKEESGGAIVVFNDIQVNNTSFRFLNGKKHIENVFNIESLSHHQQADGMLHTTLNGDLNNRLVEYTHTVGPYKNLLNGRDISYKGTGHFGELVLEGDAFVDDLLEPRQPSFNLNLQGPDTNEITSMLGIDDLGAGEFTLRATGALVNGVFEADVNSKLGDISLTASARTPDIAELNEVDLNVAINGPSLGSLTRVFGVENWPDKPFSLNTKVERVGRTLNVRDLTLNISGTQLLFDALLTNFPTLEASRVKLSISGDKAEQFHELLGIEGLATGPFKINGSVSSSPEGVELIRADLATSLGQATLSGTLVPVPGLVGSKLSLHLDGPNANSVMSVFGMDILPGQPFNLNTRVEVIEKALLVERGVLVTIQDERLELGGIVSLDTGSKGTDIDFQLSGKHLARMVKRHVGNIDVPDQPYDLGGHIQVQEEGIRLENIEFGIEAIKLKTDGLIRLGDQLSGTTLNFQIRGENLSSLKSFEAVGDSLDIFVPGQPFQLDGGFMIERNGWKLSEVSGLIGKTALDFDALVSNQPDWIGSNLRFSIKGPDLNELLMKKNDPGLPKGLFESSALILLADNKLKISDFDFETERAHGEVDLEIGWPVGSSHDISFDVNIRGEDIRNFLPPTETFEAAMAAFQLNAVGNKQGDLIMVDQFDSSIGNLQVSLKGKVDRNNPKIAFHVLSEDISKLGRLRGEPLPALPLDITADFSGSADQFSFSNLVGSLGESQLSGDLNLSLKDSKPNIKLTATSNYLDLRPFIDPKKPASETDTTTKPDRLIPATPLPLDVLASADLRITLNVAELRYWQDSITSLVLNVEQQNGSLNISQLSYEAPLGAVSSSLSIDPTAAGQADVNIGLSTKGFSFNTSGLSEEKLRQVPAFDIEFHASGKGANVREVAGTLNGSLYVASKGGSAENVDLSLLETFIVDQLFSVIMPKTEETLNTEFSCIAANLQISDGLVTTSPAIAFTTQKVGVITKGKVNLKTEEMKLNFNSTPTNALQINPGEMFYPYVLISGTLANPAVGVDPGKAALHGGAAIATLGVSVLAKGLIDRAGNTAPVCEEILNNPPKN